MPPAQFAALGNQMQPASKLPGASSQSTSLYGIFGLLTTLVTVGAVARGILPPEWSRLLFRWINRLAVAVDPNAENFADFFSRYYTIAEFTGATPDENYAKVKVYLHGKGTDSARRIQIQQSKGTAIIFALADNESCVDVYMGAKFTWTHLIKARASQSVNIPGLGAMGPQGGGRTPSDAGDEVRSFQLSVHRRHRSLVPQYIGAIAQQADKLTQEGRELKVYNNTSDPYGGSRKIRRMWDGQPFKHPATFATLALPDKLREQVLGKLHSFKQDADFYSRTGRAHKMGMLLHGPPGTGKTSFIAAVANLMRYSIYDLDLTSVSSNLDLRALLTQIGDQALVVIEDIDTVELPNRMAEEPSREAPLWGPAIGPAGDMPRSRGPGRSMKGREDSDTPKLTLGGVLNFADGIRSCCGSERIFVFTSNHPERLDPALIRPGRMDLHIALGYCTGEVLRKLAANYLGIKGHQVLDELDALMDPALRISPADITAKLDMYRTNPDRALEAVLELVKSRSTM